MKNVSKALCAAMVVSLFAPAVARAGLHEENYWGCYKSSTGSGYCYGSLLGFRTVTPNPYDWARFGATSSGWTGFQAVANGIGYACTPWNQPSVSSMWNQLVLGKSYFWIQWNDQGVCTYAETWNDSAFANY